MAQVIWANEAIDDLQRLREYYEASSPTFAERLVDQLISRTRILAVFPESGRMIPEFRIKHLREVRSGNYRILYRLEREDKVEIAASFTKPSR